MRQELTFYMLFTREVQVYKYSKYGLETLNQRL